MPKAVKLRLSIRDTIPADFGRKSAQELAFELEEDFSINSHHLSRHLP